MLEGLDTALRPWREAREQAAWKRVRELRSEAAALLHQRRKIALEAERSLGALGVAGAGERLAALQYSIDRANRKAKWYARHRLRVRGFVERRRECGLEAWEGTCLHCGLVHAWPRRCGATHVCAECAAARARRLARKLVPAIRTAHARAVTTWHGRGRPAGGFPVVTMMTLTLQSATLEDLAERNRLLSEAWNRWRTWFQVTFRRKLSYAWVRECTPGASDQGHVHMHVVTVLPHVDYRTLSDAWERALDGRRGNINFQRARAKDAKSAALYLAKYASKGVKSLGVQVGAAWIKAQHGRRMLSTSREWWAPERQKHGPWLLRVVTPASAHVGAHDTPGERARGDKRGPDG